MEANAGSLEEVREAFLHGAEGIGLLRTELFYLSLNRLHAGEAAPFQVNLLSADGPIVSYAVQVQAHHSG